MGKYGCTQGQYDKIIDKILRNAPGLSVHDLLARDVTLVAIREPQCTPWRTVHTASQGDLELVVVSAVELGLTCGGTLDNIFERAIAMGLSECPEDATDFLHVPWDYESINMGIRPTEQDSGESQTLTVVDACRNTESITGVMYDSAQVWPPEQKWAFVRSRT